MGAMRTTEIEVNHRLWGTHGPESCLLSFAVWSSSSLGTQWSLESRALGLVMITGWNSNRQSFTKSSRESAIDFLHSRVLHIFFQNFYSAKSNRLKTDQQLCQKYAMIDQQNLLNTVFRKIYEILIWKCHYCWAETHSELSRALVQSVHYQLRY